MASTKVVRAEDIAPGAFAPAAVDLVGKEDDLMYDVGHLAAFDYHPADLKVLSRGAQRAVAGRSQG